MNLFLKTKTFDVTTEIRAINDDAFMPILGEEFSSVLDRSRPELCHLLQGFGSPLNLLFPYTFRENLRAMQAAFNRVAIDGRVMYAAKVNRSKCFFNICASERIGVDVSSLQELEAALAAGVNGELCSASGPFKSGTFLKRAIRAHALIAIDSVEELRTLLSIGIACDARLMFRWSGDRGSSRFGMDQHELADAIVLLHSAGLSSCVEGVAFHLCGYSLSERTSSLWAAIQLLEEIRKWSPHASLINIGGGLPINYLAEDDWRRFQGISEIAYAWQKVPKSLYPHWSPATGPQALTSILESRYEGIPLKERLSATGIRLLVEPGRALLDQAGFSLFHVSGVRRDVAEPVAVVDGLSFSLSETWFGGDLGYDPILIAQERPDRDQRAVQCFIGGSSCYENDVLTWRKISFPNGVDRDDILVFANTAGYLMDMIESEFHLRPTPARIALDARGVERCSWVVDAHFEAETS
ncbi:alanine racemase [Gibbsiella quercinecans]|uniref:alanine racemase n=1 Tax=Gibbsiella quercinecans TaxID=929813 RepID=UPI000EF19403|nr:alanine racemase [Gibbsiella quercinecans]RLM03811.1 hypothetical protein BIY27_23185 [Gibbsiella quercinecans]